MGSWARIQSRCRGSSSSWTYKWLWRDWVSTSKLISYFRRLNSMATVKSKTKVQPLSDQGTWSGSMAVCSAHRYGLARDPTKLPADANWFAEFGTEDRRTWIRSWRAWVNKYWIEFLLAHRWCVNVADWSWTLWRKHLLKSPIENVFVSLAVSWLKEQWKMLFLPCRWTVKE